MKIDCNACQLDRIYRIPLAAQNQIAYSIILVEFRKLQSQWGGKAFQITNKNADEEMTTSFSIFFLKIIL